jgi:hypothetical protein
MDHRRFSSLAECFHVRLHPHHGVSPPHEYVPDQGFQGRIWLSNYGMNELVGNQDINSAW